LFRAACFGLPQKAAVVGFDNRAIDRQFHAYPVTFDCVEALIDIDFPLVKFRARIADTQDDAIRFISYGSYKQFSWAAANCAQSFHGVDNQIENHLLQLESVRKKG
jgi:hypothetical protein